MASKPAFAGGNLKGFPFRKLPGEIQNLIEFKSGLYGCDKLALRIAVSPSQKEYAIVHDYLCNDMKICEKSLVVLQAIWHSGSPTKGSADWARYAACKQELHDNPELKMAESRLAIPYAHWEHAMNLATWAEFIFLACGHNFAMWSALSEGPDDFFFDTDYQCFSQPTNTEIQRVVTAVHQFRTYEAIMHKTSSAMSFDEASRSAAEFFRNLTPWEKEQLLSIPEILMSVYLFDVEQLLDDDEEFQFWMHSTLYEHVTNTISKRLIRFLEEKADVELNARTTKPILLRTMSFANLEHPPMHVLIPGIEDDLDLYHRIDEYMTSMGDLPPWSSLMQMWAWSQAEEDLVKIGPEGLDDPPTGANHDYRELLNFHHDKDRDNGPQESWIRWYLRFRHQDRHWFVSDKLAHLRSTGYMFWDEKRMRRHWSSNPKYARELRALSENDSEGEWLSGDEEVVRAGLLADADEQSDDDDLFGED